MISDEHGNKLVLSRNQPSTPARSDRGISIEYTYDKEQRLTSVTRTDGQYSTKTQYLYDDPRNIKLLTGIQDNNNRRFATWTYDDQGRAISSEHANGAEKVTLAYNDDGSTTVTNEYGKQATYRFQVIQGIKRIVAIEGEPSPNCPSSNSTFTYDERGLLTSKRDNNGNLTYQYNARGLDHAHRGRRHCAGAHHHNRLAPDPVPPGAGQRARPDHPLPVRRRGTQDRRDRHHPLTRTTPMRIPILSPPRRPRPGLRPRPARPARAGAERAWSYSYNALGLIERADGPRTDVQDVTLYAYDSRGNLTQVTNALGQVTRLGDYDERGKPGSITDANGVTSSLAYTGVDGWLASVSTAGSTTRFDYDAVGQITRVTRGDGSWLSYEYDDARRLVAIGNNLGERLEYDVDTKGNRTAQRIKDASGSLVRQQQWAYDELGRLLRAVGAGGQTRSFAYDLNDNPVGETNPRQFAHSQAFDALDRLVGQSDPLGGKTQLAYDAQDNLTEVRTRAASPPATNTTASAT